MHPGHLLGRACCPREPHAGTAIASFPVMLGGEKPYAHVNIWRLNDAGASWDDTAAQEVAVRLRVQPGFRSYTLIRTHEWEVVAVTIFDSQSQLESAMRNVADLVNTRVKPLAEQPPDRRAGAVIYHAAA
jgi:hypothetical protein